MCSRIFPAAALSESDPNLFPKLRIVLTETSHPGNIGATARAMKNMGVCNLVLIAPDKFPDDKATARAASAADVLENARVVATFDEAIADCQLVIGTSSLDRRIPWPMLDARGCGQLVQQEHAKGAEIAIVFGREAHGMKNEELQKCHFHVKIPTGEAYNSLNLGMAVQVMCYEVFQAQRASEGIDKLEEQPWDMDYASQAAIEHMFEHLEETLIDVGFHDPENPRQLMTRLRRMFNRIHPDQMEVNIFRGFLTAVQQKLGKK